MSSLLWTVGTSYGYLAMEISVGRPARAEGWGQRYGPLAAPHTTSVPDMA